MQTADSRPRAPSAVLGTVVLLARLLERLDASPEAPDAAQYRGVALRLAEAIDAAPPGPELDVVLANFRAAAEVYENLRYAHAGLCRSPLEASLNAELIARAALDRAAATDTH